MAIAQVGVPNQISYSNHSAFSAKLPFKSNENCEQPCCEEKKSNSGLILGLALVAILAFAFRKKLGFSKEVTKAAEEAPKLAEKTSQTAENVAKEAPYSGKASLGDWLNYYVDKPIRGVKTFFIGVGRIFTNACAFVTKGIRRLGK